MELYIGGFAQGKLEYVKTQRLDENAPVAETLAQLMAYGKDENIIFNRFHEWFRKELAKGGNPEEETEKMIQSYPGLFIICDEVGNGIVPMDAFEREYRERLGRCLCKTAAKAERVERIMCGIGNRIK